MLYNHIVDHETSKVLVKNASDRPLRISQHHKLGHLLDITYDNCFLVDTQLAYDSAIFLPSLQSFSDLSTRSLPSLVDSLMEIVLDNWIKVYRNAATVKQISELVSQYPSIWKSQGFVQIPPEQWMKVQLKPGWESKVSSIKLKVYPLGNNNRRIVDNTFNEMHKQRRLKFTTDPRPFSFLVFVVRKIDVQGNKKNRAVVDIQKLNKLVLPDSYPLLLQLEIIANVQGCTNLVVLDAASFFY